jgi:tetratricopeptide (TPR) repeat protein
VRVRIRRGDLAAALTSYRDSHDIFERLAQADPGNAGWQRDLALSYGRIALIERRQGARDRAIKAFRQGRDIIAQLMRRAPDNATLPDDLAWFDSKLNAHKE